MGKAVTSRQMEALESLLVNGDPHQKRDSSYDGKMHWVGVRTGGGSKATLSDNLRRLGFMSTSPHDREIAREFNEYGWRITAGGLQYLIENSKYPMIVGQAKLALPERLKREAVIKAAIEAKETARREAHARSAARQRASHIAELRKRLIEHGLGTFADGKSDDELLSSLTRSRARSMPARPRNSKKSEPPRGRRPQRRPDDGFRMSAMTDIGIVEASSRIRHWLEGMRVDQPIPLTNERYADLWHITEAAAALKECVEALEWIRGMTDIEADFDGFEAREKARTTLAKVSGK